MDNSELVKPSRSRRKTKYKGAGQRETSGLTPKTDKQKEFIDALKEFSQVFVLGPAGTGKTYITATVAADLYTTKKVDKIVIDSSKALETKQVHSALREGILAADDTFATIGEIIAGTKPGRQDDLEITAQRTIETSQRHWFGVPDHRGRCVDA